MQHLVAHVYATLATQNEEGIFHVRQLEEFPPWYFLHTPNMIGVAYYRFAIITPAAPTNNLFIPIALTKPLVIPRILRAKR
jgi:hypothetical protein